jgi:DNA ligase D-like protein (predicted 3'-phosphoesterase)
MNDRLSEKLRDYKKKRNFRVTSEPEGRVAGSSKAPHYVIQKHDARNLHYDFRIAVGEVLKSWAVPKGISTDKSEKRLAIRTEDHPLEYANFEGVIPENEYGGGTVMIWDRGKYKNITEKNGKKIDLSDAIDKGHFLIWIEGEKIKGGYAMTRIRKKDKEQWLLVKMDDEHADARRNPVSTAPDSVISGDSLEEIRKKAEKKK